MPSSPTTASRLMLGGVVFVFVVVVSANSGVFAAAATAAKSSLGQDCHGKVCHPVEQYCSAFIEGCDQCANICDDASHNYHADTCAKECPDYKRFDPLKAEIHSIHNQQRIILVLMSVLLALIAIRYGYKCIRWLRQKRCISLALKKLQPHKAHPASTANGKDLRATTIQNVMTINDMERAPSQIYSVTGTRAEGSVMTMTTPVSTRYPAENSTTPTSIPAEYSYDNEALAVTPVSEKPAAAKPF